MVRARGARIGGALLFGLLALCIATAGDAQPPVGAPNTGPRAAFPARVTDVAGRSVDVAKLSRTRRVVVVTLKATWCAVCQEQLRRIRAALADPAACGIAFVVLSPGPAAELAAIAKDTGFDAAFVVDEGLRIARSLDLVLGEDQIQPAILVLQRDRTVGWIQIGRNAARFGDAALLDEVNCGGWI